MGISNTTVKKLFGRSAGRCNICAMKLIEEDVVVGEMAHVIPQSQNGPRSEYNYDGDIHSYDNLILLCKKHHKIVDTNVQDYPPERLLKIKNIFTRDIDRRLDFDSKRYKDIRGLRLLFEYIYFLLMEECVDLLPDRLCFHFLEFVDQLDNFKKYNKHLFPFFDDELNNKLNYLAKIHYNIYDIVDQPSMGEACLYFRRGLYHGRDIHYLNDEMLDHDDVIKIRSDVYELKCRYSPALNNFMAYVKQNYPEVEMDAY